MLWPSVVSVNHFFLNLNDTSSNPQSLIKSLLALFCQIGPFTPGLVWNGRAHFQWTRFHTPARGLRDNRRFIVWNLSAWSQTSKVSPGVALFGGLPPHRLHGHPNPHKRSKSNHSGMIGSRGSRRLKQIRRLFRRYFRSKWLTDGKGLETVEVLSWLIRLIIISQIFGLCGPSRIKLKRPLPPWIPPLMGRRSCSNGNQWWESCPCEKWTVDFSYREPSRASVTPADF